MTDPKILAWVEAERLDLADFLDTLDEHDWTVASLCTGWTIHHVAAHLTTSTRTTLGVALRGMVRARFDFDRMEDDFARDRAARYTPAELIAQVRETAGSPRRAPGAGPLDPLADTLVHGQDIARPLGRERVMPLEQTLAALDHVRTSAFYGARKRFRGLRLIATDADWAAGTGSEELRATAGDLLLLATGRPAGLTTATGPAASRLAAAL
jgi:uncharacterized protein (TIGR03083 family)